MEVTVREDLAPTLAEKQSTSAASAGVELVDLGSPVVADVDRLVTALDPIADGALIVAAQPDVPRNVTVTVTDADDSVTATVTVTGKAMTGEVIQEIAEVAAGVGKEFVGTKIFASVTSAIVSDTSGAAAGDTVEVGVGSVIGLPKPILASLDVTYASLGAVPLTPTAIATGLNTSGVDASGSTYNGTKVLRVAYRPRL